MYKNLIGLFKFQKKIQLHFLAPLVTMIYLKVIIFLKCKTGLNLLKNLGAYYGAYLR